MWEPMDCGKIIVFPLSKYNDLEVIMELLTIDIIREKNYDLDDGGLEVKQYLPLAAKQILINKILEICKKEENGTSKIDFTLKEFAYEFSLVNQYSNLDCQLDNIIKFYDELKENGIIDLIIKQIPVDEINFIDYVLEREIEQILNLDNSIEIIVGKALNKLIEKLPDEKGMNKLIKDLPKQINKIDPSKLQYITKAIGWNNGVEK